MRKYLILLLLSLSVLIYSNGSNNPNDPIYDDIDLWYGIGLIDRLPPIRPYPSQFIISVLEKVKTNGDKNEQVKANKYLELYTNNRLDKKIVSDNYMNLSDFQTISGFGLLGNVNPHEYIYGSLDVNLYFFNRIEEDYINISDSELGFFPKYRSLDIDYNDDDSNFSAGGLTVDYFQGLNISSSVGDEKMWFQSGLMRSSFGPLYSDSVVLNPSVKQTTHYSYTWMHDNFTLSYLLLPILASNHQGEELREGKFLSIRSYDFYFTDWWNFQFYESVVYGRNGLKPEYMIPFGQFFYSAGLSQTLDVNSMMGVSSVFRLPQNIDLKGTVYVDDLQFNELTKLNFDVKMKMAGQFNLDWTANKKYLKSVSMGYTAILPYMYTHIDYEDNSVREGDVDDEGNLIIGADEVYKFNYQNYTHMGDSMGPYAMDPNSDKIALNIKSRLPFGLNTDLEFYYIRHGNATPEDQEGLTEIFETDGSINDTGFSNEGRYLYNYSNAFLTQDVLERVLSTEISLYTDYFELGFGEIMYGVGYTYTYTMNKDLEDGKEYHESLIDIFFEYKF